MNSILVWLVAVLLGLGSVTTDTSASTESAVPAPAEAMASPVQSSSALERRFAAREMLPPCGMVDVTPRIPGVAPTKLSSPRKAWSCLQESLGRSGAELVTLESRSNGPTVHTFYRATRQDRLEIWTQRSRATPGRLASRWSYQECTPGDDLLRQPCAS